MTISLSVLIVMLGMVGGILAISILSGLYMMKLLNIVQAEKKDLLNRVMAVDYQKYQMAELSRIREEKQEPPSIDEMIERLGGPGVTPG